MSKWFFKDPDEIWDYTWDWSEDIESTDTVTSATVTGSGVTIDGSGISGQTVTARVSGGTIGTPGSASCHAVFASGQEGERTIYFTIRDT